jgi:hypothetical protein
MIGRCLTGNVSASGAMLLRTQCVRDTFKID